MRISAEQKEATRRRILQCSTRLFKRKGYAVTTTRDVAEESEIATGTLFNYFKTKEAIVAALVSEAVTKVRSSEVAEGESFSEELFSLIASELRALKPHRRYVAVLAPASLNPMTVEVTGKLQESFRTDHLERVETATRRWGFDELTPVELQLYWALYVGVLTFWSNDSSPKQKDTLAVLDQSTQMFVGWLNNLWDESQ